MLSIRRAAERGHLVHDGLESYHTFSFAEYYEPGQMGFRCLRVLNEDHFASGCQGYAAHPHRDLDILLLVLEGELGHEDELDAAGRVLRPGDVQGIRAGRGLVHREYNASEDAPCRVLEMWFQPARLGLDPGCHCCRAEERTRRGRLELLASPDGRHGTVSLDQEVFVYHSRLDAGRRVRHVLNAGRAAWIQVLRGRVLLNRKELGEGDGAALEEQPRVLDVLARSSAELLLIDLP